jgi:RimJ/RimL family protein N-acetyltransferase
MGRLHGRRISQRTAILLIAAVSVLVIGILLAAIVFWRMPEEVAEPTSATGSPFLPIPSPSQTPRRLTEVEKFVRDCEKSGDFIQGQVDYPVTLSAKIDQAITYSAAVDIRSNPLPPGRVIEGRNPGADRIVVQCVVGARLLSVGGGIDVDPSTELGGWRYLKFTPSGILEWSWSVTPRTPVSQELRLELKPAAEVNGFPTALSTADYVTHVEVEADFVSKLSFWFQTRWKLIGVVAAAIAAAVLGILKFGADAHDAFRKLFPRKQRVKESTSSESTRNSSTLARRPRAEVVRAARAQSEKRLHRSDQSVPSTKFSSQIVRRSRARASRLFARPRSTSGCQGRSASGSWIPSEARSTRIGMSSSQIADSSIGPASTRSPNTGQISSSVVIGAMPFAIPWSTATDLGHEMAAYYWRSRAEFSPKAWTLDLLVLHEGVVVGCQGFHTRDFLVTRTGETGSWLGRLYQGRGIGTLMRQAICVALFDHLGAEEITSAAFLDNPASLAVSRKLGYVDNGQIRQQRREGELAVAQQLLLRPDDLVRPTRPRTH